MGAPVEGGEGPVSMPTTACPRCRTDLPTDARFCSACGSPASPASPLTPGTGGGGPPPDLPARYRIVRFLGRGGMGRVYLCHDGDLDVEVAVKVLPGEVASDEGALLQIRKEARASARFRECPGILSLYGFERHGETRYLVMEFAAGGSLHERLKREGRLPEAECRRLGAEVAEALAFAHEQRVIHRDVKPANVLLDGRGRAKVADFGIARVMAETSARMSLMTVAGTPVYMAPEIVLQRPTDHRADLYSLGCMLFEMSTGHRPFEGAYHEVMAAKMTPAARPPDPREFAPHLGADFAAVVRRLLANDPDERYPDASATAAALRPGAATSALAAPAGATPPPAVPATATVIAGGAPPTPSTQGAPTPSTRAAATGPPATATLPRAAPEGDPGTLTRPPGAPPADAHPPASPDPGESQFPVPLALPVRRSPLPLILGAAVVVAALAVGVWGALAGRSRGEGGPPKEGAGRTVAGEPPVEGPQGGGAAMEEPTSRGGPSPPVEAPAPPPQEPSGPPPPDAAPPQPTPEGAGAGAAIATAPPDPAPSPEPAPLPEPPAPDSGAVEPPAAVPRAVEPPDAETPAPEPPPDPPTAVADREAVPDAPVEDPPPPEPPVEDVLPVPPAVPDLPPPPEGVLAAQRALAALPPGFKRSPLGRIQCERDGAEMVLVPAGAFSMGSDEYDNEKPVHVVTLSAFLVDRHEVTNAQFAKFVQATGWKTDAETDRERRGHTLVGDRWGEVRGADWRHPEGPRSSLGGREGHPVSLVSWNDAKAYCAWAGRRLPTEAEFERCLRGGVEGARWPWGEAETPAGRPGNFADLAARAAHPSWVVVPGYGDGHERASAAGACDPNPLGLFDVSGNVSEWCADWYASDAYATAPSSGADPRGPESGLSRVLRGGSWADGPDALRCALRLSYAPHVRSVRNGFRGAVAVP